MKKRKLQSSEPEPDSPRRGLPKTALSQFWSEVFTRAIAVLFGVLGMAMIFQSERFSRTPAYANLITLAPAEFWGSCYLVIAVLLAAWRLKNWRWIGVVGHTLAFVLLGVWLIAFIIRYLTDSSTTIVNVVSWSMYLLALLRSSAGLESESASKR